MTFDFWGNLFLVLAAFSAFTGLLVVGYGILARFPDEAIERIARKVFGA